MNSLRIIKRTLTTSTTPIQSFEWEKLFSSESKTKCVANLKKWKIQMAPTSDVDKFSAVLIPIVKDNGLWSILYTLRSSRLSKHVRQVSFPGGNKDQGDKSYEDCALRETEEEVGIDRSNIEVWGIGNNLITNYRTAIMPVIGQIHNYDKSALRINKDEVEKVFTVPIEVLCQTKRHTQYVQHFSLPVFTGGEERVWGITGIFTHQFLKSLLPNELYEHKIPFLKIFKGL